MWALPSKDRKKVFMLENIHGRMHLEHTGHIPDWKSPTLISIVAFHALSATAALFFLIACRHKPQLFHAGKMGTFATSFWFGGSALIGLVASISMCESSKKIPQKVVSSSKTLRNNSNAEPKVEKKRTKQVSPTHTRTTRRRLSTLPSPTTFGDSFSVDRMLEEVQKRVDDERQLKQKRFAKFHQERIIHSIKRGDYAKPGDQANFFSLEQIGWLTPELLACFHHDQINRMICRVPVVTQESLIRFSKLSVACVNHIIERIQEGMWPSLENLSPDQAARIPRNILTDKALRIIFRGGPNKRLKAVFASFHVDTALMLLRRETVRIDPDYFSSEQLRALPDNFLRTINPITFHTLFSPFDRKGEGMSRFRMLREEQKLLLIQTSQGKSILQKYPKEMINGKEAKEYSQIDDASILTNSTI